MDTIKKTMYTEDFRGDTIVLWDTNEEILDKKYRVILRLIYNYNNMELLYATGEYE